MRNKALLHILTAVTALACSAACQPQNSIKPETSVKAADWHNVSSAEGSIEVDDITIQFPAGTFTNSDKVAVSKVKAGQVGGERECSEFYQLTFPKEGTGKECDLIIKCEPPYNTKQIIVRILGWNRHTCQPHYITTTVLGHYSSSDQTYLKAKLPPLDPGIDEQPFFSIGIIDTSTEDQTKSADTYSPYTQTNFDEDCPEPETKAGSFKYKYLWAMQSFSMPAFMLYSQKYPEINNFLGTNIPIAHQQLKDLGFELPSTDIIYKIEEFDKDETAWGYMESSKFVTSWGYVRLNAKLLFEFANAAGTDSYNEKRGQIQQTLVHETSHAVHEFVYDPRTAPVRNLEGLAGDEWALLSEAVGCWTEKVTGDKRISENTPFFCKPFLTEFWPHEKSSQVYRDQGYGMGFFVEYIASNLGNDKVIKLYKNQHDGSAKSVLENFQSVIKGTKIANILTDKLDYFLFLQDIFTGKRDSRADLLKLLDTQKYNGGTATLKGGVYPLGVLLHKVSIPKNVISGNTGKSLKITQGSSDFTTYVYFRNGEADYSVCAVSSDEMSDEVSYADIEKHGGILFFATTINQVNSIDLEYDMVKKQGAYAEIKLETSTPPVVPKIWSVGLEGDIPGSFINEGWTDGSGYSEITVKKVSNGFFVSCEGDYYSASFTILSKGSGFGDVINIKNSRPGEGNEKYNFTIDRLPLNHFDSGKDASHGDASWKGTWSDNLPMYLEVYFDRME